MTDRSSGCSTWRVPAKDALIFAEWETECACFDRRTGETHLLSALPATVLMHLFERPRTAAELAQRIARAHRIEGPEDWPGLIESSLAQLRTLDLIEPDIQ